MEVTRNKKVMFLEDITELVGFRPECKGSIASVPLFTTVVPGIAQPGFRHLCSPIPSTRDGFPIWVVVPPARRERGSQGTGSWDEQRSSAGFFFFPDTWVRGTIPGFFLTWVNAVGVLGATKGWLTQA